MKYSGKYSSGVGAPAEAENEYPVSGLPLLHQKAIPLHHIRRQTRSKSKSSYGRIEFSNARDAVRLRESTYARIVIDELFICVSLQTLQQPDDIRVLPTKFVARPIAT